MLVIQLAQGAVRGVWRLDSAAFLGIPFAEAPVGELRYAAPVPADGWRASGSAPSTVRRRRCGRSPR